MKRADVDKFEKLNSQLDSLHQEMSVLSKKSPNDAVNAFKIKFVNVTLEQCNKMFGKAYKPFPGFDVFPVDELPSNSDVTFMVSQYIEAAEKFRADHIAFKSGNWYWRLDDGEESIRTLRPKRLVEK